MLKSTRVALTPVARSDLPLLHQWINSREDVLFNAPYKPVSEEQHRAWFEALAGRTDAVVFGIRLLHTQQLVGSCQLHSIHPVHRTAELQIRIGSPQDRGKGLGTEATALLLDFAFRDLNLERVHLHVFATNERAIRMYEKLGFAREGLLRQAAHIDGRRVDVVVMGILRSELRSDVRPT